MTKDKMAKQDCIGCTEYKKIEKLIEDLKNGYQKKYIIVKTIYA